MKTTFKIQNNRSNWKKEFINQFTKTIDLLEKYQKTYTKQNLMEIKN